MSRYVCIIEDHGYTAEKIPCADFETALRVALERNMTLGRRQYAQPANLDEYELHRPYGLNDDEQERRWEVCP